MERILIIDDDVDICNILENFLTKNGYKVEVAHSGKHGFTLLSKASYDLVLCDYNLGDVTGDKILEKINEKYPETIIIFISGYGNIPMAVNLVKEGAYHFLPKPLYPDNILETIQKALSQKKQNISSGHKIQSEDCVVELPSNYIKGVSKAAKKMFDHIALVAPTDYSVIIHGETGTGKEALARLLHDESPRKNEAFIAIDCGSLGKELAGSELFGHLKGSFTGAIQDKKGAFEMADGGTLFLDEIGNLSYDVQMLLLRALQEKVIRRIGDVNEKKVDVRVIAASNEDLMTKVQNKEFREDLYHRLNDFRLEVPLLRERREDILLFAEEFIKEACVYLHKKIVGLSEEVKDFFSTYSWPGNIRELQNVIKRACLLTKENGLIEQNSLPLEITEQSENIEEPMSRLKDLATAVQHNKILEVLERVKYNKSRAAEILKIDRKTLYNKLKEMGKI
jgi:two-component system response regulator HydG